jgi:hypothetical protein
MQARSPTNNLGSQDLSEDYTLTNLGSGVAKLWWTKKGATMLIHNGLKLVDTRFITMICHCLMTMNIVLQKILRIIVTFLSS